MAEFDPEHATVPDTDFTDRNSAERFLECGKFRPCSNLLLPLIHQPSPPVNVYVPICAESRFNKAGVAKHLPMPNPGSRIVSPIVYTTVGQWAPLISCPSDCKGYRSKQPASPAEMLQPAQPPQDEQPETVQANAPDNSAPNKWSRDQKIGLGILIASVLAILISLMVPEVRQFVGLEKKPSVAVPTSAPAPTPAITKVFGVFAKNVEELRKTNKVTRMKEAESDKTLSEIPAGSFGFASGYFISDALKDSRINAVELQPHAPLNHFEIDKLSDGQLELVGYVGPETLENVRSGLSQGEAITFYSYSWPDAANVVAIPLTQFLCPRERSIPVDDPTDPKHLEILGALDCKVAAPK